MRMMGMAMSGGATRGESVVAVRMVARLRFMDAGFCLDVF